MSFTVLFVDDDDNIVNSFKRNIRNKDITILTAHNGLEALDTLQKNNVQVLISDIRMPKMNGIELLSAVADSYPHTISIAISGEADKDDIKRLINRGHIWQYIEKPFNMGFLFVTLKNAYEVYCERQERLDLVHKLDKKTKELEELNQKLEEKVAERTKQLFQRTEILHKIIDGESIESINSTTSKALCEAPYIEAIIIDSPLFEQPFTYNIEEVSNTINAQVSSIYKSKKTVENKRNISLPLLQQDEIVGVITIILSEDCSEYNKTSIYESTGLFSPLITMTLTHKKLLMDLPDLMDEIESVLGEIE